MLHDSPFCWYNIRMNGPTTQIALLWQAVDLAGYDHCHVRGTPSGWSLEGVILAAQQGWPLKVTYRVSCDRFWRIGMVVVTRWRGIDQRGLHIGLTPHGAWLDYAHGGSLPHLEGCTDLDLGFTPATHTIALRRLGLEVGHSREVRAAGVRGDDLSVEPVVQQYTRLDERRYRYQSGDFAAVMAVDDFGLVVDCPGLWKRVGAVKG